MQTKPISRKKRGVALVFALFTAALLVSMSATVVALSIRHGRDGSVANYSDQALQAANWGIEATINYMGVTDNWEKNRTDGMYSLYSTSFHLKRTTVGRDGLGKTAKFFIKDASSNGTGIGSQAYYGLNYKTSTKVGEENWRTADTRIIEFGDFASGANNSNPYKIIYDDGTFAMVSVAMTEIRYPITCQPSQYQLVAVSKVYASETGGKKGTTANNTKDGYLLATRVVEARVREQTAFDFMHYVQNAKAWDVNGTDPAQCVAAQNVVGMPFNYKENGRLRIDGGSSVPGTAGNFNFFDTDGNGRAIKDSQLWKFNGDVTIAGDRRNISFSSGQGWDNYKDKANSIFVNGLRDTAPSLGLPKSEDYCQYARDMAADKWSTGKGSKEVNIVIGGNSTTVKSNDRTGIDDVYFVDNTYNYQDHSKTDSLDITPRISKVQIVLDGDRIKVKKVGGVNYEKSAYYPAYGGENGIAVSSIKNGILTVTGGNVEVVSAYSSNGKPKPFKGNLTIVADVDASRETATNDPNRDYARNNGGKGGSIYSERARRLYEDEVNGGVANPPPYSQKQLGLGSSNERCIVPVPVQVGSEGKSSYKKTQQEREGNAIIASDIKYSDSGQPRLGIVAKNFVLLNESKQPDDKSNIDDQLKNLSVDAVLMSLDHSVQFDWDNWAWNPNHDKLMKTGLDRYFNLNGAIVSGFLDVEGDNQRRGYYNQQFKHDENLRYQLPPSMPRWDRTAGPTGRGVVWNWLILNYIDNGALNRFN